MVKFFPEREYINQMKPSLTEGEKFLLSFLAKYLGEMDGEFEVFFRARLSSGLADVIVILKNHGVLIIKVVDNLSAALIAQMKSIKKLFCENCRIGSPNKDFLPIQTAVFFYGATKTQVKNFFGFVGDNDTVLLYNYVLLLTADGLERDGLQNLPKRNFLLDERISATFTEDIYDEICRAVKPFGEVNSADDLSDEQWEKFNLLFADVRPNVKFFPELKEILYIRPLPTDGELFLLNFLKDYLGKLSGEFEVFFQAHWDGLKPDVVVMRKNHGILIIEVKDWNLDSYQFNDKNTWIVKKTSKNIKSPVAQANLYKDLFYDTYSRTLAEKKLRDKKIYSLVQTAVFFYGATKEQVTHIPKDDYIILLTQEELESHGFKNFSRLNFLLGDRISNFFTDDIYEEICRVLKPSEHSQSKIFFPTKLSLKQQELARSSRNYKRQIKGSAGSGKTTVLAFRAVDAFRKTNAPVLILMFNITLRNYIHDCISQALNSVSGLEGRKNKIMNKFFMICHFHEFIRGYRAKNNFTVMLDSEGKDTYKLENVPKRFKTIYVDETQDFKRSWMKTIIDLLEPGGELIFFGDKDQDLYQVRDFDKVPTIIGRPLELKGTYRLHTKILDLARAFQIKFFNGSVGNELESTEQNLFGEYEDEATTVRYEFFPSPNVDKIVKIFEEAIKEYEIPNDDICILSQVIKNVRLVDKALRDKGYKTITTFEKEEDYQEFFNADEAWNIRRAAKFGFWMESGKIKLATIQSYKGWGIHTEILIIGNESTTDNEKNFLNPEMVYTGITRAKKNLVIINIGNTDYDQFFKTAIKNLS